MRNLLLPLLALLGAAAAAASAGSSSSSTHHRLAHVEGLLQRRGGAWGKKAAPAPAPVAAEPATPPPPPPLPPLGPAASAKAVAIMGAATGSWALLRNPAVRAWFEDLSPIHKYFPFSRHQVLIVLAWLMNKVAVRVPGRSDGKSWKETIAVRFFTPSAYAFAIWAPIFLGELLLTFYQLGSPKFCPKLQPYLARLAPPLAQAFTAQSLWCVAFRPWVGRMQFVPSALLALTAVGLSRAHAVLREAVAAGAVGPLDYLIVHLPLSLHFGWITCATLVNLNGWFAVSNLRTGDKLGLALASVNLAVTLGSKVTLATGDPVISLVVAWALYAVADDLLPNKSPLRKSGAVGPDALDALETTARVSAGLQAGVALAVILWKVGLRSGLVAPGDGERLAALAVRPIKTLLG